MPSFKIIVEDVLQWWSCINAGGLTFCMENMVLKFQVWAQSPTFTYSFHHLVWGRRMPVDAVTLEVSETFYIPVEDCRK